MRFTPPVGSALYKLWPDGIDGEMIYVTPERVQLRVVMNEQTGSTAVVIAEWKNVEVR